MGVGPAGVIFFGMIVIVIVAVVAVVVVLVTLVRGVRRRAHREGSPSVRAYLAAAPRTDEERRDSVDLALNRRRDADPKAVEAWHQANDLVGLLQLGIKPPLPSA